MLDYDHYLRTPQALLVQHYRRARQRLHFEFGKVEPRAKGGMPAGDKDEVQRQLLQQLTQLRRRAFRGPVALRLTLATTDKNPAHVHNIAKNLLDLFGKPRPSLASRRQGLLYADDSQVHALSITCRHGNVAPMVSGVAIPLGGFLEDLRLATQFATEHRHDTRDWENLGHLDTLYDEMKELRRDEAQFRQRLGDEAFESLWNFVLQRAQEQLLGRPAITPFDLAKMYNLFGRAYGTHSTEMWNEMFASSPLRIRLSELPQVEGTSTSWKQEIDRKLRAFQKQWGRIVNPLLVPVALEVVIRPPPASRQNNLHDLDNVLRTYLIPRVVDILKPLSHHAFTVNEDAMQRAAETDPQFAKWRSRFRKPPVSTKLGFTRYEAWRLPPSDEGSDGFVSVAIVSDMTGHEDILGQVDEWVEKWREVPSLGW